MLKIIRGTEKHKYEHLMQQMFRLRFKHLVERRKWSLPTRNGLDIDQYDVEDAVYFLLMSEDESIYACARVNKTTTSSLLADLFPHLIESGEAPRGPRLYEGTRFIIEPIERSRDAVRRAKSEILAALVEWCLEDGATDFQAVIDANMLPNFVEMSLRTRPMGLAHEYGGGMRTPGGGRCLAFRWSLSTALLDDLRAYGLDETSAPRVARPSEPIGTYH